MTSVGLDNRIIDTLSNQIEDIDYTDSDEKLKLLIDTSMQYIAESIKGE